MFSPHRCDHDVFDNTLDEYWSKDGTLGVRLSDAMPEYWIKGEE